MSQDNLYNPKLETIERGELEQLQFERLQSTLNRVYRNVAFYRTAFDAHGVNLEKIKSVRSLEELPFTTKEDLRRSYPYDMFALPLRDIVRIHSTSGATGRPIVVGYTRNDLRTWTECAARLLAAAGVTEHDVVQIALDYSLNAGGFGFHQGAEQIGASVIPASLAASVEKQVVIMRDFKTTALVSTPSHAASIAAGIEEMKLAGGQLRLRLGLFGGEQWSEALRGELERRLGIIATDSYGSTEIMGPGVAGECSQRHGLHVNEDHFIVETIDPKTLVPVGAGEEGELVFTTITKEGFPLIRYRTGDITSLDAGACPCGRTFLRMARVTRRTDDLVLFHGIGFFPSEIEEILVGIEGTSSRGASSRGASSRGASPGGASPHYQIILGREHGVDTLEVKVEVSDRLPSLDEPKALAALRLQIARRIKAELDLDAEVTFAEPKSLHGGPGGLRRVVDKRPG